MPRAKPLISWMLRVCCLAALVSVAAAQPVDAPEPAIDRELAAERALERIEGLTQEQVEIDGDTAIIRGVADDRSVIDRAAEAVQQATGAEHVDNRVTLSLEIDDRVRGATNRLADKLERWIAYLPLIPLAIGVLAVFVVIAWLLGRWSWPWRRLTRNPFLRDIARKLTQAAVVLIGLLFALEILDAMALVGGVLGAAGVAGIAIGFAFRDLVENYIASVLLSIRQPFRPRDHVVIDGREGLVSAMNTRSTVLATFDGNIVRIPNAIVFKTALVNYSTDPRRRFEFDVGVGYDVDLARAIDVGAEMLAGTPGVLDDPAPFGLVQKLGDSSITLRLFGWVDQTKHDFGRVRSAAMQQVKAEYDRLDIDMPEPAYKVRIESGDAPAEGPKAPKTAAPVHEVTRDEVIEDLSRQTEAASGDENLLQDEAPLE